MRQLTETNAGVRLAVQYRITAEIRLTVNWLQWYTIATSLQLQNSDTLLVFQFPLSLLVFDALYLQFPFTRVSFSQNDVVRRLPM